MELSATQVIGGALAAASAAVFASLLGVYGTVIGAAVVSVLASVGGAVYTHSFRKGRQVIVKVRENRTGRMMQVQDDAADEPEASGADDAAAAGTEESGAKREPVAGRPGWRERLAGINPKAVAVTAAWVLVLSLGGILFAETVLLGKPISSALGHGDDKGGNTLTRLSGNDSSGSTPSKSPTATPTATPTTTVTETETPDDEATQDPTTTAPTRQPTSEPATSRPTSPPTSSSKPTTSKAGGTSSAESTAGQREQAPGE